MGEVGILAIDVLQCKDLKDKDWFSKNDPYVVLELKGGMGRDGAGQASHDGGREVKVRTKTLMGAGANPVWTNEKHDFQIIPNDGLSMEVEVFDFDDEGSSDSIGKTVLALDSVFRRKSGESTTKWYDIFSKKSGKVRGQIQLGVMWVTAPPKKAPAPVPAPAPAAQPAYQPAYHPPAPQPAYQPPAPPQDPMQIKGWFYVDPNGQTQGPHTGVEMKGWSSYFSQTTQVMAPGTQTWAPLSSFPQIGGKPIAPPAPAPAPAATGQLLQVTCPPGVHAGQVIYTRSPAGAQLAVTVPPGVSPGMIFHVRC
jgi:hypothetical protein